MLEKLQENPLGPFVILRVRGVDLAGPVKGYAEGFELLLEAGHIFLCDDGGMHVIFDREVFGRQAERIPADGIQDVVALHAALARDDVERRVGARMADVQPLPGGVGKFDQRIVLRLVRMVGSVENARFLPFFLPAFLNRFMFVFHRMFLLFPSES